MRFIDQLFNMYRDHLTGDEEDLVALVVYILEEQERDDLLKLIHDMSEDEIYQMLGMFMVEMLRKKAAEEGIGTSDQFREDGYYYH
ncbi:MAG: hypothetical protein H0Z33_07995 [Bacillaceae bacterium]|nr:hypothetical protein [Bacillaceae bacterium]